MGTETIARVRFSEQSSAVTWQSGSSGKEAPPTTLSLLEHQPKSEHEDPDDVEFSALDPEVGAILTQVTPAACGQVAITVKRVLRR
jgi:hypothetical protein